MRDTAPSSGTAPATTAGVPLRGCTSTWSRPVILSSHIKWHYWN